VLPNDWLTFLIWLACCWGIFSIGDPKDCRNSDEASMSMFMRLVACVVLLFVLSGGKGCEMGNPHRNPEDAFDPQEIWPGL
jgi:hypothetical protein